jgi:hypothetical protein
VVHRVGHREPRGVAWVVVLGCCCVDAHRALLIVPDNVRTRMACAIWRKPTSRCGSTAAGTVSRRPAAARTG